MKDFLNIIFFIFTVINNWLSCFFGGYDRPLYALVTFITVDYITEVMCALNDKTLFKEIGFKSICRKVSIFLLVGIAHVLDVSFINSSNFLRTTVILFYVSNTGSSILKNVAHIGLPMPPKIKIILKQLLEQSENVNE